jgi:hypothetical protein
MYMITEDEPSYHLIALYRRLSARPHRILYVGLDSALLKYLAGSLNACWIVRAPAACVARPFIEHLKYSLLVFDAELMDTTARELANFTRALPHRRRTPIIIIKQPDEFASLARAVTRLLPPARRLPFT